MEPIKVRNKTQKIAAYLKRQIQKGRYAEGDRIPSAVTFASQFGVNKDTVNAALQQLVAEGLVYRSQGSGTFVSMPKNSKTIAALLNDIGDEVCPRILRGMEDAAVKKGYSVLVCNTDENSGKQKLYLEEMLRQKVAGLAIIPICFEKITLRHYLNLVSSQIPFVFMNRYIPGIESDYVIVDNTLGAYQAVKHLIKSGHRRIAYISVPRYSVVQQRLGGYEMALKEHGISVDRALIKIGKSVKEEPGYKYMNELLKSKNPPSAVFAFNDEVAHDAYWAVIESGLKVPDDVAVVGFGDSQIAKGMEPLLTTVHYPAYEVGRYASEILIERIESGKKNFRHILLKPELIIRQSCGSKKNILAGV